MTMAGIGERAVTARRFLGTGFVNTAGRESRTWARSGNSGETGHGIARRALDGFLCQPRGIRARQGRLLKDQPGVSHAAPRGKTLDDLFEGGPLFRCDVHEGEAALVAKLALPVGRWGGADHGAVGDPGGKHQWADGGRELEGAGGSWPQEFTVLDAGPGDAEINEANVQGRPRPGADLPGNRNARCAASLPKVRHGSAPPSCCRFAWPSRGFRSSRHRFDPSLSASRAAVKRLTRILQHVAQLATQRDPRSHRVWKSASDREGRDLPRGRDAVMHEALVVRLDRARFVHVIHHHPERLAQATL